MSLRVTRGTWASCVSCAVLAPEDMEGIFFGFPGGAAISFRLLGIAGAGVSGGQVSAKAREVMAERAERGLRPLAWVSLRRSDASLKSKMFLPSEKELHQAFKGLGLDSFRGCVFRCSRSSPQTLNQTAICVQSELRKVKMYIEPDLSDANDDILPPEGALLKKAMQGCEKGLKKAGDALEAAVSVAAQAIPTKHATAKRFLAAQRAAAGPAALQKKTLTSNVEKPPATKPTQEQRPKEQDKPPAPAQSKQLSQVAPKDENPKSPKLRRMSGPSRVAKRDPVRQLEPSALGQFTIA